jgi:hypothetical protein
MPSRASAISCHAPAGCMVSLQPKQDCSRQAATVLSRALAGVSSCQQQPAVVWASLQDARCVMSLTTYVRTELGWRTRVQAGSVRMGTRMRRFGGRSASTSRFSRRIMPTSCRHSSCRVQNSIGVTSASTSGMSRHIMPTACKQLNQVGQVSCCCCFCCSAAEAETTAACRLASAWCESGQLHCLDAVTLLSGNCAAYVAGNMTSWRPRALRIMFDTQRLLQQQACNKHVDNLLGHLPQLRRR